MALNITPMEIEICEDEAIDLLISNHIDDLEKAIFQSQHLLISVLTKCGFEEVKDITDLCTRKTLRGWEVLRDCPPEKEWVEPTTDAEKELVNIARIIQEAFTVMFSNTAEAKRKRRRMV